MVETAPVRLPVVTNLSLIQEKQPYNERTVTALTSRGASLAEISRIASVSANVLSGTEELTDEKKTMVLAGIFLSLGFFSEDLDNWKQMIAVVSRSNGKKERSFATLLCLEIFYNAKKYGSVDYYFSALKAFFEKSPSPLANDHRIISNAFTPRRNLDKMPNLDLSADIHRLRRKWNETDGVEEFPLGVPEDALFEQ